MFDELSRAGAAERLHGRHRRRCLAYQPDLRCDVPARTERRGAGGVLRARRRRHGGRQQEQREDHRRGCRAVCPGLLRLRLAQVRRTDDIASALWAAADPCAVPDRTGKLRRLPPVPVRRAARRAAARRTRRHGAAERSVRPGRGVGPSAARHAAADHRPGAASVRHRRLPRGAGGGLARAHQHGAADLLLRHLRRAAARSGDRAYQARHQQDLFRQRSGGGGGQLPRG